MIQITRAIMYLLLPAVLFSCSKNSDQVPVKEDATILGTWIKPVYQGDTITYQKSNALEKNEYGLAIQENAKIIERKNSGWCGTPPIVCSDFEGTWKVEESVLTINGTFWGGKTLDKYKIVKLTENALSLKRISDEIIQGK